MIVYSWRARPTDSNPLQKQGVEVRIRLVGLPEPLLIGWVSMQRTVEPKLELGELMFQLTSRFDSLRVTPRLLDTLANGSEICGDLAVDLALAGPQFTQLLRNPKSVSRQRPSKYKHSRGHKLEMHLFIQVLHVHLKSDTLPQLVDGTQTTKEPSGGLKIGI